MVNFDLAVRCAIEIGSFSSPASNKTCFDSGARLKPNMPRRLSIRFDTELGMFSGRPEACQKTNRPVAQFERFIYLIFGLIEAFARHYLDFAL